MNLIETTYQNIEVGFEHTVKFDFEGRTFFAVVIESEEETFIRDCYQLKENLFPIDIPKYFGEFSGDVFTFIYNNIQRGFPQ
jgi:hypothetical protein